MVKIFVAILLTVIVLSGALYTGIVEMVGDTILVITNDFLPYVPIELRLGFFLIILGIVVKFGKSFIQ